MGGYGYTPQVGMFPWNLQGYGPVSGWASVGILGGPDQNSGMGWKRIFETVQDAFEARHDIISSGLNWPTWQLQYLLTFGIPMYSYLCVCTSYGSEIIKVWLEREPQDCS